MEKTVDEQIDALLAEIKNIEHLYSDEIAALKKRKGFYLYSDKADKEMEKIAEKYAPLLVEKENELQKLTDENYNYLTEKKKKSST